MANQEELKKIIKAIQSLPTLPNVAVKVNSLIKSPTAGSADLAKVIELDQSISAKVLSLINSAYYGLSRKINNIKDAVTYLGTNAVSQLVLALGVLKTFEGKGSGSFDRKAFWIHCIAVAVIARAIAKADKRHRNPEDVFTAALLHDIGKVAMDNFAQDTFQLVLNELKNKEEPFFKTEQRVLGIDHSRVGEWVARSWELPLLTVVSIRHHHEEPGARKGFNLSQDNVVDIVAVSDWLAITNSMGNSGSSIAVEPSAEIFSRANITKEQAQAFADRLKPEIAKDAAELGI